ncbi:hypothetical protein EM20IM_08995 [Candidatus Methylacidiphilum infernorum]|uniref:Uncharacterized protein n=1 Tax=Candidatus Methylacidiphilum infernorum TaxID=511746 RepID=A0ABX7PVI0_9BACT|nr:hypothetical protein [Candidatus Methylacidiphilum infernorum]QSR86604.1 hypothetical protein EM20IM_08995 [Candidatus Methylacidiphilum infernorum]
MSKKKKGSLLRNSHGYIIPSQEMLFKVDQMIRKLDKLSTPQSILHGNPEVPGIVLERSMVSPLDRKGKEYKKILKEYEEKRPEFLAALANHPVGKSLSLLAVGKEGVEMMRKGKVPKLNLGTIVDDDGIRRNAIAFYNVRRMKLPGQSQKNSRDCYNCHHIIQKSVKAKHLRSPNDPENLVLVQSFRTHNNQFNPHHFWHALFLHPQINGNPGVVQPYYAPRPLFPVYPPVQKPIHSIEQLREELKKLDPQATLPHSWENKIIAFSRLLGNQPYRVPARYREAIKLYQRIYSKENKEETHALQARNTAAQEASPLAKEWLPPGAVVNGQPLPFTHKPKFILPIVDRANRIQKEGYNSLPLAPKKNKQRKEAIFYR